MRPAKPGKRQLRSFGLIVGGGFAVIGFWPLVFRTESPRTWALVLAAFLAVTAVAAPAVLRLPFRVWMAIGELLGWINTRIILGIVYYLLIVPTGVVFRVLGKDPMRLRFDPEASTYRVSRSRRPASHMERQY